MHLHDVHGIELITHGESFLEPRGSLMNMLFLHPLCFLWPLMGVLAYSFLGPCSVKYRIQHCPCMF